MRTDERQTYLARLMVMLLILAPGISVLTAARADGGGSYSVYDTDRDGYLDSVEFEKFAEARRKHSSAPDAWAFDKVDTDSDGKISEQEMVNALMDEVKRKTTK
ncbi:MAG: EF-hand domain-containing protein [Gammaproteobacteria bacterium]|nr:EF-hand domain-containing protein [Gammaproteobacteria bacterium]